MLLPPSGICFDDYSLHRLLTFDVKNRPNVRPKSQKEAHSAQVWKKRAEWYLINGYNSINCRKESNRLRDRGKSVSLGFLRIRV